MSNDEKYGFLDNEAPEEEAVAEVITPDPVPETVVTPEPPAPVVPTTTEPEATHVPLAALKAEREKRQAAERRMAEWEAKQAPQQPEVPAFYEAPEQHIQAVLSQAQQQVQARMYAAFEEDAREAHPDYDEVLAELSEAAAANPLIRQQVFASANPAKAAYKLGKQLRDLKTLQDPDAYSKAIAEAEARGRQKYADELAAAEKAKADALAAIPPDLSATRSSRGSNEPVEEEMTLDSILASRKR